MRIEVPRVRFQYPVHHFSAAGSISLFKDIIYQVTGQEVEAGSPPRSAAFVRGVAAEDGVSSYRSMTEIYQAAEMAAAGNDRRRGGRSTLIFL